MSTFGWSLPPGCGALPGEQSDAVDLTRYVLMPEGVVGVYWTEDDELVEVFTIAVPADLFAGQPARNEYAECTAGLFSWNDELDEEANKKAAAGFYMRLKTLGAAPVDKLDVGELVSNLERVGMQVFMIDENTVFPGQEDAS